MSLIPYTTTPGAHGTPPLHRDEGHPLATASQAAGAECEVRHLPPTDPLLQRYAQFQTDGGRDGPAAGGEPTVVYRRSSRRTYHPGHHGGSTAGGGAAAAGLLEEREEMETDFYSGTARHMMARSAGERMACLSRATDLSTGREEVRQHHRGVEGTAAAEDAFDADFDRRAAHVAGWQRPQMPATRTLQHHHDRF